MESLTDQLWDLLWNDIGGEESFPHVRPLLAHYTSAVTAEAILKGQQLWLSHPILMNDVEELHWGIRAATTILFSHKELERSIRDNSQFKRFVDLFEGHVDAYYSGHAKSIFIACFSRHDEDDRDGLLSMWRAYGSNGEGVALVFDTAKLTARDESPLVLSPVRYCVPGERESLITEEINKVIGFFDKNKKILDDESIHTSAYYFLEKIKFIALTTKHRGFMEEKEWRLIYFPERDLNKEYEQYVDYAAGATGFQPKLKIPIDGRIPWLPKVSEVVSGILLGPSHGSVLAVVAFERMLDSTGLGDLKDRIHRSSIPFRSRGF